MVSDRTIVVTGATGQQGGAVARELLGRGFKIRAMTRKPEGGQAKALQQLGIEVTAGDLNDGASLARVLQGAWGVFAVQNTWEAGVEAEEEQGKRLADAARKAGVTHFVYSSVGSAHRRTGIPHFENKSRVEEKVRSLGFPSWTILRPVFFMENWVSPWFKPGIDQGQLTLSVAPATRLQMIAVADIGKYGRLAFEKQAELNGRAIDIAGDEVTMPETAKIISDASGRKVDFVPPPIAQVRQFSEDFAMMCQWFDSVGYNADIKANAKEFGISPTSLADWAKSVRWS